MSADWRIYYGDDTTYEGLVDLAPTRNVQVIVQIDDRTGWYVQTGDYYCWLGDRWQARDIFGLWDYLASSGWKRVLFGRTVTNGEFTGILARIKTEWGPKANYVQGERKL